MVCVDRGGSRRGLCSFAGPAALRRTSMTVTADGTAVDPGSLGERQFFGYFTTFDDPVFLPWISVTETFARGSVDDWLDRVGPDYRLSVLWEHGLGSSGSPDDPERAVPIGRTRQIGADEDGGRVVGALAESDLADSVLQAGRAGSRGVSFPFNPGCECRSGAAA